MNKEQPMTIHRTRQSTNGGCVEPLNLALVHLPQLHSLIVMLSSLTLLITLDNANLVYFKLLWIAESYYRQTSAFASTCVLHILVHH